MFETLLLNSDRDRILDTVLATALATLGALLLAHTIIKFHIGGVDLGGLIAVFLTSLALTYPLTTYIKQRDLEEISSGWDEPRLLRRHMEEVEVYLAAFITSTFGFAAGVLALPESFFTIQYTVLDSLNATVGYITADSFFLSIISNNTGIFFATFALSFLISGGMVFIVIWNASVLGVLIGVSSSHILEIPVRTAPYLVHGSLEVAAYILAGLAGTLLSLDAETFFTTEDYDREHAIVPVRDAVAMLALGFVFLLLGGIIEA